jgi:hypothetical protein
MAVNTNFVNRIFRGWRYLRIAILVITLAVLMAGSATPPAGLISQVSAFTRPVEFDFGTWTLEAIAEKFTGWGLSLERFLSPQAQSELVLEYLAVVQRVNTLNAELTAIYTNPSIPNPDRASQPLREELQSELGYLQRLAPLAEAVLQAQLMAVIQESGLGVLGQAFPPSLYQVSDIPQSLVISPRTEIRRELDISLTPGISIDFKEQLEHVIFSELDHAALVVPVGGIGTYPTMVMQSSNLVWLTEVIAHEWVHNYLTLRPLGINYFTSEELRTINETTATLAGQELGLLILAKYYPEHLPPPPLPSHVDAAPLPPETVQEQDVFNFQAEMRLTRVETDRLLAEGDVEGAEAFMESRRQFFWDNGYPIRKLNQAYFAFYGAYSADPDGGAAGEDPVGPAVQALRARYDSLAEFLNTISWVTSYDALLRLLQS